MTPARSTRRRLLCAMLATSAMFLAGCGRDPAPTVTVYVSADERVARPIIAAFEAETGIRVDAKYDTEATKTTGLATLIETEGDNPRADVFWSSECFMMARLADLDLLAPHESDAVAAWPEAFRDPDRRWHGFAARARVIVYAPDRVDPEIVPATIMELARDHWRDRIVLADPRFGTTRGHAGAMKAWWERHVMPGYYDAFVDGLRANNVRLLPGGNAGVVRAIAAGEADIGLTDTDDVWAARANGATLALTYPRHAPDGRPGGGTLLIPNTVARVRGGPHPETAGQFVDFLLSERVERMLAESDSHNVPLRPGLSGAYPDYAVPDPLEIDLQAAVRAMDGAVETLMQAADGDPGSDEE